MSKKEILRGIRELIRNPAHWTRGALARNAQGQDVPVASPDVQALCLTGAIYRFDVLHPNADTMRAVWGSLLEVIHHRYKCPVPEFNDTHSHTEVLAVLDEVISAQE